MKKTLNYKQNKNFLSFLKNFIPAIPLLLLLLLLAFVSNYIPFVSSHCVMYGVCESGLPCNQTQEPIKLPPPSLSRLNRFCSHLIQTHGDSLCCDPVQVEQLISSLYIPESLIGKCPTCFHNLVLSLCDLVCSPAQSSWLKVVDVAPSSSSAISKLAMYMSPDYVHKVYGTCKDVQLIAAGNSSMMNYFCGPGISYASCSPKLWFEWIGSVRNGFIPFELEFKYQLDNGEAANMILYDNSLTLECCDSANGFYNDTCTREDCPRVCESLTTTSSSVSDSTATTQETPSSTEPSNNGNVRMELCNNNNNILIALNIIILIQVFVV